LAQTDDSITLSADFWQEHPLLLAHLQFVLKHNEQVNLTSVTDFESGKVTHIEDSLAILPEVLAAPEGDLADIGSGAGYPGIPLALISGRRTLLIESIQKKAALLTRFTQEQGLQDLIEVAAERSEAVAQRLGPRFSVVTARAVAALPALVELGSALLHEGGVLLAQKGRITSVEEDCGLEAATAVGLSLVNKRLYTLSDSSYRTLYVFQKFAKPSISLPRRPGLASKRPLCSKRL
jgi:16S rRNA (guanine527-N7)-methyltransferase